MNNTLHSLRALLGLVATVAMIGLCLRGSLGNIHEAFVHAGPFTTVGDRPAQRSGAVGLVGGIARDTVECRRFADAQLNTLAQCAEQDLHDAPVVVAVKPVALLSLVLATIVVGAHLIAL
jgi:hypothetical protein